MLLEATKIHTFESRLVRKTFLLGVRGVRVEIRSIRNSSVDRRRLVKKKHCENQMVAVAPADRLPSAAEPAREMRLLCNCSVDLNDRFPLSSSCRRFSLQPDFRDFSTSRGGDAPNSCFMKSEMDLLSRSDNVDVLLILHGTK